MKPSGLKAMLPELTEAQHKWLQGYIEDQLPDFCKPGGIIMYKTIKGKNYVELDWLTHQMSERTLDLSQASSTGKAEGK